MYRARRAAVWENVDWFPQIELTISLQEVDRVDAIGG
jgi:hypothetical protein